MTEIIKEYQNLDERKNLIAEFHSMKFHVLYEDFTFSTTEGKLTFTNIENKVSIVDPINDRLDTIEQVINQAFLNNELGIVQTSLIAKIKNALGL